MVKVLKFRRNQIICTDFKRLYKRLNFAPFLPPDLNSWSIFIFDDCFRFLSFTNCSSCSFIITFSSERPFLIGAILLFLSHLWGKYLHYIFILRIFNKFISNMYFLNCGEGNSDGKNNFSLFPPILVHSLLSLIGRGRKGWGGSNRLIDWPRTLRSSFAHEG